MINTIQAKHTVRYCIAALLAFFIACNGRNETKIYTGKWYYAAMGADDGKKLSMDFLCRTLELYEDGRFIDNLAVEIKSKWRVSGNTVIVEDSIPLFRMNIVYATDDSMVLNSGGVNLYFTRKCDKPAATTSGQ